MEEEPLPYSGEILPLESLRPNPDDVHFRASTYEEVLTRFAKIKDPNVIARPFVVVE